MEAETKQVDILEQFCLLAKSARGKALVQLIETATSEPNLFAFGELLEAPHIKEMEGSEHAASLELLKLFAFGTWPEYKARAGTLPKLSPRQVLKLKQLTVMTLAETSKTLTYETLMQQLDVSNVRELEDLLINDCMYAGIAKGKLDQQRRCFEVQFSLGRDLRPGQLDDMVSSLGTWMSTAESLLSTIEDRIKWADRMDQQRTSRAKEMEERAEDIRKAIALEMDLRQEGGFADFGSGGGDYMEEATDREKISIRF